MGNRCGSNRKALAVKKVPAVRGRGVGDHVLQANAALGVDVRASPLEKGENVVRVASLLGGTHHGTNYGVVGAVTEETLVPGVPIRGGTHGPNEEEDSTAHRLAGKVHVACGNVVPMFIMGTTPNLRCARCSVTEPAEDTCWQVEAEDRQRCAMGRFVPSDTTSKWYCLRCWRRDGQFMFVGAMNQACPRCGGFAL